MIALSTFQGITLFLRNHLRRLRSRSAIATYGKQLVATEDMVVMIPGTVQRLGLPMAERKLAFAVQGQSYGPMFDEKLTVADWKTKQSWAIISTKDRMLPLAMEESAARRMGAVTTTVETCHMSILQEPARVAAVIDEAARTALAKWQLSRLAQPASSQGGFPIQNIFVKGVDRESASRFRNSARHRRRQCPVHGSVLGRK
jgi:hypothetical protein